MGAAEALGGTLQDRLGYAVGIGIHVAVPEAEDGPAFCLEEPSAIFIPGRTDMLAAVDFDDQLRLPAG